MFRTAVRQLRWTVLKPEFSVCVIIGAMGYIFDLIRYVKFSVYLGEPLNVFEPFVASSSNYVTVTISVFALLFLLSDLPNNAADDNFTLLRMSRRRWLCSKIIYMLSVCALFYFVIAAITFIAAAPFAFVSNVWSVPVEKMCFEDPYLSADLFGVSYYAPEVVTHLLPIQALLHSYALVTLYSAVLCMLLLSLKLLIYHQYISLSAVYIIHALGYLPLLVVMGPRPYSLFAEGLLTYHIFTAENSTLSQTVAGSYITFAVLIAAAFILSNILITIRKFRGGKSSNGQ